jgi:E1A/CREB-binding protein
LSIAGSTPKPWHSESHAQAKRDMNTQIIELLRLRRPNATSDWQQKLPQMAKRLEEALYSDAASFQEYSDRSTLKGRLQLLASSMGNRIQNRPGSNNPPQQPPQTLLHSQMQPSNQLQHGNTHPPNQSLSVPSMKLGNGSNPNLNGQMLRANSTSTGSYPLSSSLLYPNNPVATIDRTQGSRIDNSMQQQNYQMNNRQFVSLQSINPIYGVPGGSQESNTGNQNSNDTPRLSNFPSSDSNFEHSKAISNNGNTNPAMNGTASHSNQANDPRRSSGSSSHTDEHRKQVLKQQQQRLLLLRHASKCPYEPDQCTVTPHCASMKQLWSHIMSCKDQECPVAHCVSSRYVLSHYSKCKEPNCPVCGPVRDAIKKNSEKNHNIASTFPRGGNDDQSTKRARGVTPRAKAIATDNVSCAIYSFTDHQIRAHISHLQDGLRIKATDVKDICFPLIEDILKHQNGYIFSCPVDPIGLGIPDYPTIIKMPMDIGTVRKRLDIGYYRDIHECASDVRLCFDNAMLYNPSQTEVHKVAKSFKTTFDKDLKKKMDSIEREIETKRLHPDNCPLCGEGEIMFEPPNIYCNGSCNSQRIRRNSYYYVGSGAYHWCNPCFNELKDPIKLVGGGVLYKKDLVRKKHVEEIKEPWVQCDHCERWVHQICSLFNGRRNLSVEMPFICPLCLLEQRKKHPDSVVVSEKKTQAADLPHTLMSEFIEKRVNECLERAYQQQATKLGKSIEDVEKAPALCVRQVSSVDHPQRVREGMLERYKHKNYPSEFPCRTKCVLLFQNLDGQDVILFGMYVYEYGHKTPQPNQRRVYISYLDSVHYFRPRQYRTPVYHEIIISYLEYVKRRGFHTAHIWACPPMKGDDYIFNCHPQDQKTPKDDRLRLWYVNVLERCKERGIVQEVVDFHTEFMADTSNDATVMPYFDGDYWVGEAENIIRNIKSGDISSFDDLDDSGGSDDDGCTRTKRKAKSKSKSKRSVRPRLSRTTSAISRSERDYVMAKISSIIEPMKEAFFVARLHSVEYANECATRRAAEISEESNNSLTNPQDDPDRNERKLREEALLSEENTPQMSEIKIEKDQSRMPNSSEPLNNSTKQEAIATTIGNNAESKSDEPSPRSTTTTAESSVVDSKPGAVKRQLSTSETLRANLSGRSITEIVLRDDTEDGDDTQENEHFETRLAFLNLCQGNHYQFDQLRRAKYTSLMTLYHLHNPDAPKFSIVCERCSVTILTGHRYNCESCEIDYCQSCYSSNGSKLHHHPLRPIVVSGGQPAMQLTEEQRRERQRSISLHLQLLEHASICDGIECKSKNCQKMKVRYSPSSLHLLILLPFAPPPSSSSSSSSFVMSGVLISVFRIF